MVRRNFLRGISLFGATGLLANTSTPETRLANGATDREYWVSMLTRITLPLLESLADRRGVRLMWGF